MSETKLPSTLTREAVLAELTELAEGRHPDCQTITGRFIRDPEFQQASEILCRAIQAEQRQHRSGKISPPPGWLLPA